uniref:Uncharacterized protein n=1 Tax=Rhizophora mucronata TaxID=61149 RepID=A0A2P2NTR0_RHIMU
MNVLRTRSVRRKRFSEHCRTNVFSFFRLICTWTIISSNVRLRFQVKQGSPWLAAWRIYIYAIFIF